MKRPLWLYVLCVVAALVVMNSLAWLVGGEQKLRASELFSIGFLLGMTAMYVAVHLYRHK